MTEKDAFHVLKLSLFSSRLLSRIEVERPIQVGLNQLVSEEIQRNGIQEPFPLVNQSTLFSQAYICLVWGWAQIKSNNHENAVITNLSRRFNILQDIRIEVTENRIIDDINKFLEAMRNACAHGHIIFVDDSYLKFSDKNATISMQWNQFGKLCDDLLFSWNDVIY